MLVSRLLALLLLGATLLPTPLFAQGAVLSGTVTDSASGDRLVGARVEARDGGGAVAARTQADLRGRFRLALPAGRYAITVSYVGYAPSELGDLRLTDGTPRGLDVALTRMPYVLPAIDVVSRSREQIIDAPGAASVVPQRTIEERAALTPSDHLRDVPGINLASKGLAQATFSARGPSAVNSAGLLVLHDYRLASVPSLRLNVPYLIPTTSEDLDRIEVARGPSSAIYGPDADRGVVNFITKSPFASRGTTASLAYGERSVFQADFRHAGQLSQRVAMKVSAEYFTGDDWAFNDPHEIIRRDPHVERASGEARLDWRANDRTTVIFSGGLAQAITNVDQAEIGSLQVKDWRYTFGQARILRDRLFVNLFYNQNDAGRTLQLYTGAPIVEDSRAMSAQAQYGSMLGRRIDLTYGLDVQRVIPRTDGTIHGRNEDRDDLTQAGLYLSTSAALSSRWSLIGAARADHHSRLDDFALSPRAGLVFKPSPNHAFRFTFNRATSTPVANDLFLDLQASNNLGGLPFGIRARGTIDEYSFRRDCNGGLCMRSPFVGDATAFLPLDATLGWQGLVQILQSQGIDISQIPAPTASEVTTALAVLDPATQGFDQVNPSDVRDIPAGQRSYNSTFEAGYRGFLGDRFSLSLDVYYSRLTNVGNPLTVQTPNAFLDRTTLTAYLSNFMSPQNAAAIADTAAGIPLGTVSPIQGDSTEILLIGRQGAQASFWGADLALTAELGRAFALTGTYSWTSEDLVPSSGGFADIVFNSPRQTGSLSLAFRPPQMGLTAEVRGRAVSSFPVRSGVYRGQVSSYAIIDASFGYRLPWIPGVSAGLSASNVLDNRHREFVGAPEIGRLLLARVRVQF